MEAFNSKEVYDYIISEETSFKTTRIPITGNKDWNMSEHIERCTNVANGWYHSGKDDGNRPYYDIVTPIKNVALRSEGFDVKDIIPFINDKDEYFKSFLIKKYHPQWARKNELDTFIDDVVESSVVYDLALVKDVKNVRPELVALQTIAFCDQTNVLAGALCLKHQYTPAELVEFKGKWNDDKIDEAIIMAKAEKTASMANDKTAKTPGKYITVYELVGNLPEHWLEGTGEMNKFRNQRHFITFYTSQDGTKNGITLFKGKDKKLTDNFKALVINKVHGRACGKSLIETLFEPQVWSNYSAIKIKKMLDSAISVFVTDSDELGDQKLTDLKLNTILKQEQGRSTTKLDGTLNNLPAFTNYQQSLETNARILGSASESQLGVNPTSGTPFALQNLVVQQGQGIHEFRQGKIATFFADVLYRDWILAYIVKDMNNGKDFSEELSMDEIEEIGNTISDNLVNKRLKEMVLNGEIVQERDRENLKAVFMEQFKKTHGKRGFFEILKGELDKLPIEVMVNIKGKQKNMAKDADAITNIIREVIKNPQAFAQVPGISKAFNEVLENSGLSPIDFSGITKIPVQTTQPVGAVTS